MPLYGYLEHKRLALLDLNPAVRDNRLILRVNFSFHAPRDAASGGQSARHRHQPAGNAILFATDRYGMRSHASWGSQEDVMLVFMNQDAYDKFRLSKEDYALVEELREQVAIAQCEENESHFKYGFSAGLLVQQEAHAQMSQKNKE